MSRTRCATWHFLCASEHAEQAALIQWWRLDCGREREALLFAIPNGGFRNPVTGSRLKAEGVIPGVPDLFLAIAREPWHGLFLEMKRSRGGQLSRAQTEMLAALSTAGYRCEVCHGWRKAANAILDYLGED